jgi:secreted trypsin-like serine protease
VGDHNQIESVLEAAQKEHNVLRKRLHPRYGGPSSNFANDIAILRLATPITFRPQVSPVCIPPAMEEPAHGTNCFVTGWGKLSSRSNEPARLQEGSVKIMGKEVCTSAQYWGRLLASQVCASGQSNAGIVDACKVRLISNTDFRCFSSNNLNSKNYKKFFPLFQGDSGGPLVCQNPNSKKWVLQGLVSFGSTAGYVHQRTKRRPVEAPL